MSTSDMQSVIYKLLDKAGKDPRLTPRLLREKAEKSLSLTKGELKAKREQIKDMIFQWYLDSQKKEDEVSLQTLKLLAKVGKVSGYGPAVFKGLKELPSDQHRIVELRKRLREKGLTFSDIPTVKEIEKIKEESDKKRDLEGIDSSLVIDGPRKRGLNENNGGEDNTSIISSKQQKNEEVDEMMIMAVKKSRYSNHSYASDEEAEAEF